MQISEIKVDTECAVVYALSRWGKDEEENETMTTNTNTNRIELTGWGCSGAGKCGRGQACNVWVALGESTESLARLAEFVDTNKRLPKGFELADSRTEKTLRASYSVRAKNLETGKISVACRDW